MAPKLYKAADVCELAQLQSYVLRSWEKEFPRIGIQKSADSPRLYRQSDVDQVLRIKQLVFGEGLTLSGARKRLEEQTPAEQEAGDADVAEVVEALASDARTRIAYVRDGLRSILSLLETSPETVVVLNDFQLDGSPAVARRRPASPPAGGKAASEEKAPGKAKRNGVIA